jgi:hypothetical protein
MKTESEDRPRQSDAIEIYVEDHQLPQNILEEIVFEKFVQTTHNLTSTLYCVYFVSGIFCRANANQRTGGQTRPTA